MIPDDSFMSSMLLNAQMKTNKDKFESIKKANRSLVVERYTSSIAEK